ncbi:unnamed protein product [Alternaria alternata]
MSQPEITAFANELLDKIFAYLIDKSDWLALCKTHRSFKASGQRLRFRDIQIPSQHSAHSTGRCSMLLGALTTASHLMDLVETLQVDCRLRQDLVFERDSIHAILAKVQSIQRLTIFIVDQPDKYQTMLFARTSATTLHVRENIPHQQVPRFSREPGRQIRSVDLRNLTAIDYAQKISFWSARVFGGAHKLEKLRFVWPKTDELGGNPFDKCIRGLSPTRHTLRELTILPDATYGGPNNTSWMSVDFSTFPALKILRIPALALFEAVSCCSLKGHYERAKWEDRGDITHLLPPNLRELEMWFKYPSGIFATGQIYLSWVPELPEHEMMRRSAWILALLQMQSLRKVRLSEILCAHIAACESVVKAGGWPMQKYALPNVVERAFLGAETVLEIEVLEVERGFNCEFESG